MIDIAGAVPNILSRLKKIRVGQGMELLTFKRDRGLRILKTGEDRYTATEFGFRAETVRADLKREFPRSNKVRVQSSTPGQNRE